MPYDDCGGSGGGGRGVSLTSQALRSAALIVITEKHIVESGVFSFLSD